MVPQPIWGRGSRCELELDETRQTDDPNAVCVERTRQRIRKRDGLGLSVAGVFARNQEFDANAGLAVTNRALRHWMRRNIPATHALFVETCQPRGCDEYVDVFRHPHIAVFAERHDEVSSKLADQSADLDVFFHALRENARVYDAAARTLKMANSVKLALKDLDSIQNLQAVQNQLVQSWGDLMKIVDEVNNGLILKPGM